MSPVPRLTRAAAAALLALIAIGLGGCRKQGPPPVVFVVVDTLRAGSLEWYGYERATSPALAPLVESGVLFEHAYTVQPQTTPAIASMFTGLYPARHGVEALYVLLHDANPTAAEAFAAAGYDTAAFVSSFVMIRDFSNLGQGFAVYDDFVTDRELYRNNYERKAGPTLARASEWLRQRDSDKPFFLFLHLIDPHGPYAPPPPYDTKFRSTEVVPVEGAIPTAQQIPGVRDFNRYRDLYDGEIAYATDQLGTFFAELQREGLFEEALIVLTADHGESMGEHGLYFRHGDDVYQENLHVPLIVKPPGGVAGGRRVADPVGVVDLTPTLLELAGLPVRPGLDGRSLAPLLRGEALEPRELYAIARDRHEGVLHGLVKTVMPIKRPNRAVSFDLATDPGERSPVKAHRRELRRVRAWQQRWAQLQLAFEPQRNFMDLARRGEFVGQREDPAAAADVERLRSLGYLN